MSVARHRAEPAGGAPRAGHVLGVALAEALDLALARACAGCGEPGTRWCDACWPSLTGPPSRRLLEASVPAPARQPVGTRHGGHGQAPLAVWSAAPYDGPVRAALVAWKDHDRPDVTPVLALALRRAARAAAAELVPAGARERAAAGPLPHVDGARLLVVPAPSSASSRRARGRRPVLDLARRSLGERGGRVLPVLEQRRGVRDQSGLDSAERAANLAGAVRVPASWARYVRGRPCLLVDDVVTTGATLLESARALRDVGAGPVVAVTVAATVLRRVSGDRPSVEDHSQSRR